jgi:hypothetical protein
MLAKSSQVDSDSSLWADLDSWVNLKFSIISFLLAWKRRFLLFLDIITELLLSYKAAICKINILYKS